MRQTHKYTVLVLILAVATHMPKATIAQTWKWGNANTIVGTGFEGSSTAIDRAGNIFEAGSDYSGSGISYFGTIPVSVATNSMIISKSDSSGNFVWVLGTTNASVDWNSDIVTDATGNVYVMGIYNSPELIINTDTIWNPTSSVMYFLIKIGAVGNVLWMQNIACVDTGFYLTTASMHGTCNMGIDGAGNVYCAGSFLLPSITIGTSTLTNSSFSEEDIFLAKYDSLGNPIWAKSMGGYYADWCTAVEVTDAGNIYIGGKYTMDSLRADTCVLTGSTNFLCKYNSTGHCLWASNLNQFTYLRAMVADADENVYLTGSLSESTVFGTDTLTDYGNTTYQTEGDMFVAKFYSSGSLAWARSAGGDSTDIGWDIAVDSCNNVWVCGTMGAWNAEPPTTYTMNFNGHILSKPPGLDYDPMFIVAYDANGNYETSLASPVGGDDWAGITLDNKGNFFISGDYFGSSPVFGADTLAYTWFELLFTAKYQYGNGNCSVVYPLSSQDIAPPNTKLFLYPNPATELLNIGSGDILSSLVVTNLLGQVVYCGHFDTKQVQVNIAGLIDGVYLVKINGRPVGEFVKQ